VGPNFTRPTAPSAARYTGDTPRGEDGSASDTMQHIALGERSRAIGGLCFRSDAIDQLVKQAVEHNRSLVASKATLAQAQELALAQAAHVIRKWTLPPAPDVSSTGRSFWAQLGYLPLRTSPFGPAVSYTLDYTGGVARSVEQQYALAEVERHRLDAAYLTVTGQAVMQTLAIASAGRRSRPSKSSSRRIANKPAARADGIPGWVGGARRCSERGEPDRQRQTLLPPLRQDLAKARHALSVVLGQAPASELPHDVDLAQITLPLQVPVSLPSELAHRPARHPCRGSAAACRQRAPWASRNPTCTQRFN